MTKIFSICWDGWTLWRSFCNHLNVAYSSLPDVLVITSSLKIYDEFGSLDLSYPDKPFWPQGAISTQEAVYEKSSKGSWRHWKSDIIMEERNAGKLYFFNCHCLS